MGDSKNENLLRPETIIEARYSLTKRQNDVLDIVFDSIKDDNKFVYDIDITQYGRRYNMTDKNITYGDLKKSVLSFEGRGFLATKKIGFKKENRMYFSWFSHILYLDDELKIIIELDPTLKKLMLNAKKTSYYQMKYRFDFHNIYSKKIYYKLRCCENRDKEGNGWEVDNLDELRDELGCPKTYERYADFKRFVLKPAYEEINGDSDISFEVEEIKIKSKVTSLKFHIKSNKFTQIDNNIILSEKNHQVLKMEQINL